MPPIAPGTRSRGNSSRMMPNASGKTAPPRPWRTRAAIMTPIELVSAATSEPAESAASTMTSMRSFPNMSPSRPSTGVATDALRRYAVKIHETVLCDVCSAACRVGSAGTTSDCRST